MIDDEGPATVFARLREFLGPISHLDRNEQAVALISAIISEGMTSQRQIVGAAQTLGFDRGHAGSILKAEANGHWHRAADGNYVVGPSPKPATKPVPPGIF